MKAIKYTTIAAALIGAAALGSCSSDFMDTTPTDKVPDALIKEIFTRHLMVLIVLCIYNIAVRTRVVKLL